MNDINATDAYDAATLSLEHLLPVVSERTGSFLTADSLEAVRIVVPAPLAASSSVSELLKPDAVLLPTQAFDEQSAGLSPVERRVLAFVDGYRPVARLGRLTRLSDDALANAIGLLAQKGAVALGGVVRVHESDEVRLLARELDRDTEEWHPAVGVVPGTVRPAAEPRGLGARAAVVVVAPGRRAQRLR